MNRLRLIIEIILVVLILVLSIMLFFCYSEKPVESGSKELSERIIERLQLQINDYQLKNQYLDQKINKLAVDIDSLENLKAKNKIIYIDRIKFIENLSTNEQAKQFQQIFELNNIKE